MNPFEYCRDKIADAPFAKALAAAPKAQQTALAAVYAFYRELQDVVRDCSDAQVARAGLAWWRKDLQKVFSTDAVPEHPVHQALQRLRSSQDWQEDEFAEIIAGMEMDLTHLRYPDFAALEYYCRRTAGTLGRIAARICGAPHAAWAEDLLLAVRLGSVASNVGRDARLGRLYLPVDELQRFNVPAAAVLQGQGADGFAELMAMQLERADAYHRQALAALPKTQRKTQKPLLALGELAAALRAEIRRDGVENVLKYKLKLPQPRQTRLVWKVRLLGI